MNNKELQNLKEKGFTGFKTVKELNENMAVVPACKGVYVVLRSSDSEPEFLRTGTGGFFKRKNPNVPISKLEDNWVDGSSIIYIGKATSLCERLRQYMSFGRGCPVGHYGGRFIWQLKDSNDLIVCWKITDEDPREFERRMIMEFKIQHNESRPFANLRD